MADLLSKALNVDADDVRGDVRLDCLVHTFHVLRDVLVSLSNDRDRPRHVADLPRDTPDVRVRHVWLVRHRDDALACPVVSLCRVDLEMVDVHLSLSSVDDDSAVRPDDLPDRASHP